MGLREGAPGPGQLTAAAAPATRRRRSRATAEELAQQEQEAEARLDDLQTRLGLRFKRRELLREAMTHTSWINERGDEGRDNERLEYLGDAVLELVAGEYLFNRFPNYDEGQLTQIRSSLVSTVALARLGEQLLLGETLRLGRGAAKSGARRLTSLHANAFEALVGAIFLDQGYRRAGRVFLSRIGDLSAWTDPNFKGRLQALAQERFGAPPQYRTGPANGDPRARQYVAQVSVEGRGVLGEGRGGTKQAAEQAAARFAIDLLVAPVSKKRRRSRVSAPLPTEQVSQGGTIAEDPAVPAPPPGPGGQTLTGGRRDSRSQDFAQAAVGDELVPSAQQLGPAVEMATSAAEHASEIAKPAPRRRRRRTAAPVAAAAQPSVLEASPGADADAGGRNEAIGAPRRRRRRSVTATSVTEQTRDGGPLPTPPAALKPEEAGPGSVPEEVRRRTHRGHRGGRRRSGRTATPEE